MKIKDALLGSGNVMTYIFTIFQNNELFQVIELILSIITSVIIIIVKCLDWYKSASKDDKIDKEEVDELVDILGDGAKDIKDKVDKK